MSNQSWLEQGQQVLMNTYGRQPIVLARGQGTKVWDVEGKEYLDLTGGIAVNALGHCHPQVAAAIAQQAQTLIHCSNLYWNQPQIELAQLLVENSAFDKVFFCNSGAEANEGALKVARKYARGQQKPEKFSVITTLNSFHGRTLATLTATGQDKVHKNFDPLPVGFQYVPYNDLAATASAITDHTCAILVEPIQGEGGVVPAQDAYLRGLRQLCDDHDLLLIYDEIQVGMGRTGRLFAYENSGVAPDVITLAKALGGGTAIGAFMVNHRADVLVPGEHGSTFGGNPLATAAGVASLQVMLEQDFFPRVRENAAYLKQKLEALAGRFASAQEVRGQGMLLGLLLDRDGAPLVEACRHKGLLINCTVKTVMRFMPPLIISRQEIDQAVDILAAAMQENGY